MAWGKAGSTTLSSSGDALTTPTLSSNTSLQYLYHGLPTGGELTEYMTLGSGGTKDSGSNYANGVSSNGGAKSNYTSRANIVNAAKSGATTPEFGVGYIFNIAGEEKLIISQHVNASANGSGTAPERSKAVGKHVQTSAVDDIISFDNTGSGDFASGSNLTALGSDVTPIAAVPALGANVQVGSRFEETDTRKMYDYSDTSKSKLKAYYHFEDNGTNAQTTGDGFGSSADMTVTGATYVTGKVGSKAISFDGTNDYAVIGLPSASSFNFLANTTHEWTVAFWLKNDDFSSLGMILSTAVELGSSRFGLGIRAQSSGSIYVHFCNGTNTNRFTTTQSGFSTDGNWHFIVITAKKSDSTNSLEFWQDGVSLGTASNSGKDFVDTNASQAPYIGQAGDSSQYLDGALDELSIWNRRLTDSEISTLYNSGTGIVIGSTDISVGDPLLNTQLGSRYEETDTRKIYFRMDSDYVTDKWFEAGTLPYAGGRGVFNAGYIGSNTNVLDYVTIDTTGNATDFGDLTVSRRNAGVCANKTRGIICGGYSSDYSNVIDYITIATAGNAVDFGDFGDTATNGIMGIGSETRACFGGGETSMTNRIAYVTIATPSNSTDFGDLSVSRKGGGTTGDGTKGIFMGGEEGGVAGVTMDYITIATTGNASDWGDLDTATAATGMGLVSNGTIGLLSIGQSFSNRVDKKTIATNANSSDYGDLTQGRSQAGQCSTETRAVFGGGKFTSGGSSGTNTIDYMAISSGGTATDFGDLTQARYLSGGMCDTGADRT